MSLGAYGPLAERVAAIARQAGSEILEVYARESSLAIAKSDDSPLCEADLRSQRLLARELAALTPGIPLLSEEGACPSHAERSRWARYWLVDPLDGTREFLSRNGEFTVNIALIEGHTPALGVVHVPATGTTYGGIPGQGAWRQSGAGVRHAVRVAERAAEPVRAAADDAHRGDSLDGFLARLGPHELKAIGSSLKLCLVAEGAADVYPRLGPTCEWDTAAAQAVVTAAGGTVVQLDGLPLAYNTREELTNPSFVAFGDARRDWLALLR